MTTGVHPFSFATACLYTAGQESGRWVTQGEAADVVNVTATTIVAPFTKQYDPTDIYPFEVEVRASNTPLNHDLVADLSQIRVVDISNRVTKNIGSVPATRMTKIDAAIKNSLGL